MRELQLNRSKVIIALLLISVICFVPSISSPVSGASITRVECATRGIWTTGQSSFTVIFPQPLTAGDSLVLALGSYGSSKVTAFTLSQTGVTWTDVISSPGTGGSNSISEIWLGSSLTSSATQVVTVNLPASSTGYFNGIIADSCEYSGLGSNPTVDATSSNDYYAQQKKTGPTATISSGPITTTQASELVVGSLSGVIPPFTLPSPSGGFSMIDGVAGSTTPYLAVAYMEQITSSVGTFNAQVTMASPNSWVGTIASFIPSSVTTTSSSVSTVTVTSTTAVTSTSTTTTNFVTSTTTVTQACITETYTITRTGSQGGNIFIVVSC